MRDTTAEDGIEMSRKYRDRIDDDDDEEEEESSSSSSNDAYELPFPSGHSRHHNKDNSCNHHHHYNRWFFGCCPIYYYYFIFLAILVVPVITYYVFPSFQGQQNQNNLSVHEDDSDSQKQKQTQIPIEESSSCVLPVSLLDKGVYNLSKDFVNELGITPPYWGRKRQDDNEAHWGPCFVDESLQVSSWKDQRNNNNNNTKKSIKFEYFHNPNDPKWAGPTRKGGTCRPGFIIIGAGKCGTSSLYHYLLGHPRVAPSFEKQIHYFIYHLKKPIRWYYSWFPTAPSFLQHGALITGEASPGYLPYPKAVKAASDLMMTSAKTGQSPKWILIGRDPLTRMYSSYRYNYKTHVLQTYQSGMKQNIPGHQPDEYYDQYLFTLEEFVRAELDQLKECLGPDGFGAEKTRQRWYGPHEWTRAEFDRRQKKGLDPLIDLDEVCYGKRLNRTVARPQWAEMQMRHPEKYIPPRSAFLIQSFIGRSLYVLPFEWWYMRFDPKDLLFYCTEDLNDPQKLNDLSMHLGLPSFNYTPIVDQGAFNVGTNQGYDTATPWQELQSDPLLVPPKELFFVETQEEDDKKNDDEDDDDEDAIPLSPELRQEVLDFIRPYNERLFRLTGKRCNWST